MTEPSKEASLFKHSLLPIIILSLLIIYGLIVRPLFLEQEALPLEIIFITATSVAVFHMSYLGFNWNQIQQSIVQKLMKAMPAFLILFSVGLIIGSWIVSGTIPMLVYYGIKLIDPKYIYIWAFIIPIIFSLLTGTSWGSIGTVGIVIMGIAIAVDAELCVTAGAIVGGAYFGDKMSPLSDTTNMAAIAADVPLYEHIHSMMFTTIPSAIIASVIYFILGFTLAPQSGVLPTGTGEILTSIKSLFNFNIFLLLPPILILYGSINKKPTLPLLVLSSLLAAILAFIFQPYSLAQIAQSLYKGFHTDMAGLAITLPESISQLFNRGGLYSLADAVIIAICVFTFIGTIDLIRAMETVVNRLFSFAKRRSTIILSSLLASSFTNAMTSNQYATSFIVGDAFKAQYDKKGIPRKVLSRSLEDAGTMIESIIPWTPTAVFATTTLGVVFSDYWHWQLLSLINLVVAPFLAITGIACFYKLSQHRKNEEKVTS